MASRRFRPRLRDLGLAAAAILAGLLLCELLLRLLGVSYPVFVRTDPVRGASHIPGVKGWQTQEGRSWVEINSDGLRGPEIPLEKPAGTFRIALLGDSYIEAVQVPFEQNLGEVLERSLADRRGGPVEVLNFGVGGYGTTQELLTLQHEVWKYSPDLVLLGVTIGNDITDNYRPLKGVDYVPYHVFQGSELVLDRSFLESKGYRSRNHWASAGLQTLVQHSRLFQLVNHARYARRVGQRKRVRAGDTADEPGLSKEVYLPPPPGSSWEEAWKVTEGVLQLMHEECRSKQTPLAVVALTTGIQVHPEREKREELARRLGVPDLHYPGRRLAEFGRREGIPVLDLGPPLARLAEERQVFLHGFEGSLGLGHPNENGHRVAGELIASWIAGGFPDHPAGVP